ncbi:MAG TPA: hypoxanthine phosphoribosyltransferase [Candidatus Coproplasma excrementigallinarum]|uniref:Hypoxanthine phosphoribosyltransferase n=1 Tax=Candidatus Coproplasma excrementigallinarum TaxID=2840747 RepID=A0A9D1MKN8_9FIRM|nr:hypoxanthine phosphoribosyltransferase [Candidatus Coproplasma excrementigallinarum]
MQLDSVISRVLYTEEQIRRRVEELGKQITEEYKGKPLAVIGVLRGGSVFCSDLIRNIDIPMELSFIEASSYKDGTKPQGEVSISFSKGFTAKGLNILIAEDIIDTGHTLKTVRDRLLAEGALSVRMCCILDKPSRRQAEITADYVGFTIPDEFVVGYGLDYAGKYRNLPYIGILSRSVYEK